MAEDNKTFFVSIPNEVLYDDLYPQAYRIAALISNMSHKTGYRWMENGWLAERFNISERTVSRAVSQLVEKGHYSRYIDPMDNNKRYLSPLPKGSLVRLIQADKHPASIDKSVHTRDKEDVGNSGEDPPASIDKSVHTYGQDCPASLDKNGVSSIDMNNEDVERGTLSLFDFLNPRKKQGQIYLAAKEMHLLLETPGFFIWFEEEVLKRFPKFNTGKLNNITLKDWDQKVFAAFGAEIAAAAVCELVGQTKGGFPTFAEAVKKARAIKSRKDSAKAAADRVEAAQARRHEDESERHSPLAEMTDDELKAELKKYEAGESTTTSQFVILRIKKKLQQRQQVELKEASL